MALYWLHQVRYPLLENMPREAPMPAKLPVLFEKLSCSSDVTALRLVRGE
jgi:hypothetical protein